ncbi:hypothetical protein WJX72_007003 [[Myrmecia] bisecta]|uniref:Uncharacterized protein n=1 Tax=[Myrmecia] bisecta TaxID=41462 RepID=A0AAW1QR84_9CHLO
MLADGNPADDPVYAARTLQNLSWQGEANEAGAPNPQVARQIGAAGGVASLIAMYHAGRELSALGCLCNLMTDVSNRQQVLDAGFLPEVIAKLGMRDWSDYAAEFLAHTTADKDPIAVACVVAAGGVSALERVATKGKKKAWGTSEAKRALANLGRS